MGIRWVVPRVCVGLHLVTLSAYCAMSIVLLTDWILLVCLPNCFKRLSQTCAWCQLWCFQLSDTWSYRSVVGRSVSCWFKGEEDQRPRSKFPPMFRLISSWSTYSKMCGAWMRMPTVPPTVTARKMYSWRRSMTKAVYRQSSRIYRDTSDTSTSQVSWRGAI